MCYDRTNMMEGIFKIVLTIATHLAFSLLVSIFVYEMFQELSSSLCVQLS